MTHEIDEARRLHGQGLFCLAQGRYDEAEQLFRRALDLVDEVLGHDHPEAAGLYLDLGRLEHARGRAAEGEALARWGQRIRERELEPAMSAGIAAIAAIAVTPSGRS